MYRSITYLEEQTTENRTNKIDAASHENGTAEYTVHR